MQYNYGVFSDWEGERVGVRGEVGVGVTGIKLAGDLEASVK